LPRLGDPVSEKGIQMQTESSANQVPFFSDAVYGRKVKRRYLVWLLMVATGAVYIWVMEPLAASNTRRLVFAPIFWAAVIFPAAWLYDAYWKGVWGRLEIETRWLVWWFVVLWQSLLGRNPLFLNAVVYGIIVLVVGGVIDANRKQKNVRLLFDSYNGIDAIVYTSPQQAREFRSGEVLERKDEVLVVDEVGFDYVYAENPNDPPEAGYET
jgi:hypothetical protein